MQRFLQQTWHKIEKNIPGTSFNFDFWTQCKPRRSTYPSCRAVIAARQQNPTVEKDMIHAIQSAYYSHARNPSDESTLAALATELGLDCEDFIKDLNSQKTEEILNQEINQSRQLGAQGFPSLILHNGQENHLLQIDYNNAETILKQIKIILEEE